MMECPAGLTPAGLSQRRSDHGRARRRLPRAIMTPYQRVDLLAVERGLSAELEGEAVNAATIAPHDPARLLPQLEAIGAVGIQERADLSAIATKTVGVIVAEGRDLAEGPAARALASRHRGRGALQTDPV